MFHLYLHPEIEDQLTAQAQPHSLAIDRYIETFVVADASDPE